MMFVFYCTRVLELTSILLLYRKQLLRHEMCLINQIKGAKFSLDNTLLAVTVFFRDATPCGDEVAHL